MRLTHSLKLLLLLATGLMAGMLLMGLVAVRPAGAQLAGPEYLKLHATMSVVLIKAFPPLYVVSLVASAFLAWRARHQRDRSFWLVAAGFGCVAVSLAVTIVSNLPVNAAIEEWARSGPPANWRELHDAWKSADTARTWLAVVGFALHSAAISAWPADR